MNPYIGITDFTEFWQVHRMLQILRDYRAEGSKRMLHVGVMMSYKTLHGIPSKWQDAFPSKEQVSSIFSSDQAYNCLHYADYDNNPGFAESLTEAIVWGGPGIHAVQLDMVWPDPGQLNKALRESGKNVEVILQIGKNALEKIQDNPLDIIWKIGEYGDLIDRVLLDKSMGKGLAMDAKAFAPLAHIIQANFPWLGITAAGGLGPETLHLVKPLLGQFPDISIDAQGQLRPSGNALDPIDWDMAAAYLAGALRILN